MTQTAHHRPTLVLGGTGRTGRRLVERLTRRHIPVRIGSRSAGLPFDWEQPSTWAPVFQNAEAAYTYVPDLAVANPNMGPKHPDTIQAAHNYAEALKILGRPDEEKAVREKYPP